MPAAGSGLPPRTGTGLGGGFMREPVHSRFLENFDWEEEKRGLGGYNPSNIGADGNDPQDPPDGSSTPWENHGRSSRAVVIALWVLSIFSTIGSFIWLVLAIWQPRWGKRITSSGAPDTIAPSTASLIVALLAKLIESAFVAVFVAFVGQVLTKRAFAGDARAEGGKKGGVTLAEISMRNWVIQPGLMITDGVALRYAILTGLGLLSVVATLGGVLYTTASDALVSPKLKFGGWESTVLESYAMASYASLPFLKESCGTPIDKSADPHSQSACVAVSLNQTNTTVKFDKNCMAGRPPATVILYDNITLTAAWIETQYADPKRNYEIHNRTINNVTLAMPHPGIYLAATDPINNILQPSDLSGLGEYLIRASAVSPAVNVLCVNLTPDELSPLVYTEWPHAKMYADEHGRKRPNVNWKADIPPAPGDEWLNRTVVDDIFGWGPNHGRRPPIFPKFPLEFNLMYNASVYKSDAVYVLGKSNSIKDYTLCSMRSWLSPVCSTHFNVSGTTGAHMRAHCEDPDDSVAYMRSVPNAPNPGMPQHDWRDVADEWGLALYMDSGSLDGQASKDRILTQMVLVDPDEGWTGGKRLMPSLAEGLAVLVGETLVAGALRAPVVHWWGEDDVEMVGQEGRGVGRRFNASMKRMQYTSTYESGWQGVFYAVLGVVFVLNVVCLGYFVKEGGWGMRDYTDPANMFLLAVNSTPEGIGQLPGESGGEGMGRKATAVVKMNKELLRMPWSIGHDEGDDVYFFRPGKTAASASTGNDGGSSRSGGMRKRLGHVCRRSRGGPKVDTSGAAHMGGGSAAIAATTDGCGGCGRRSETGTEDDEFSLIADIESQNQRHLHSQGGGSGGGGGYSSTSESSNHKWY
ncbi:hypothetical protein B0T17DRAFT_624359 [Bombardia bombarda]|uniref:Uncharacterized protein n=1 Tax=Bombardia bombarda TaxID=252184 RepID=A0AA39XKD0_9PEZI|nr:hypothetical protein B0T17DRAFT_624359 [Bombardia bombarda]